MKKNIQQRAAAGTIALQALTQANCTPLSILTAYVNHRARDIGADALTIELESTVGDLLSDVLHALRATQYPDSIALGQQIPVSNLVMSRFHQLNALLSAFVEETLGSAPDYLFRATNHYQAEQEDAATLLHRCA